MPVKRITKTEPNKREGPKRKKAKSLTSTAGLQLPTEPRPAVTDLGQHVTLMHGQAGVGKTTWMASWPDTIMLSCERISKGLSLFDFNVEGGGVTDWGILLKAIDLLEDTDRFRTVGIDTGTAAYHHCMDYVCRRRGITHPEDEGYGRAWTAVRQEFRKALERILKTGRGLVMSAHSKELDITTASGTKYTRIVPNLPGQAYDIVKGLTDLTLYAEHMTDKEGKNIRILITTGDELIDAKNALGLPPLVQLNKENGYQLIQNIINGDTKGVVHLDDLLPGKQTADGVRMLLRGLRLDDTSVPKKSKAKPKPKPRRK